MATQLYDRKYNPINPITDGSSVKITNQDLSGKGDDVDKQLTNIYSEINDLNKDISALKGDEDTVSNLIVEIKYSRWNTDSEAEVKENGIWQNAFLMPTAEQPYIWKKTTYSFKGDTSGGVIRYEVVASDISEKIQNIYIATSSTTQPTINYPTMNGQEDLTAYDNSLPEGWSETPVGITAATPYSYISTRKRVDGKWQRFSNPAQYGRWAFDSLLELRYTVTENNIVPELNNSENNPGEIWSVSTPTEFTGYLWMITATSVNGILNEDKNGIIWKGPNLMAIIQ